MAQIFARYSNNLARASLLGSLLVVGLLFLLVGMFFRSPYISQATLVKEQPVPFSHKHHVDDLGIDCRYCHTSVEKGAFAGMPTAETCMSCHSQIWKDSPMLEPVRESFRTGQPIAWQRVHKLADFVYFDHSIHVSKGIGCTTCHGDVDKMPLVQQNQNLLMTWCLSCHRNPEKFIRPQSEVFNVHWNVSAQEQKEIGAMLVQEYNVKSKTDCSVCHR